MLPVKKKRVCLSIKEKVDIISSIQNGTPQIEICRRKNLSKQTVSTIWTKRGKILVAAGNKSANIKKLRNPLRQDVDSALLKWFQMQRSINNPVSGPILKAKAEELGRLLNSNEDFVCSTGWLERFKARHGIVSGKVSGEAADVDQNKVSDWVRNVWSNLRLSYSNEDIFNCDETGLFYKLTPDATLKFKGEKCIGGKQSKLRVTVLVCANMSGEEKRKLLVIGKYRNPRCMKNVQRLPVRYTANKRAWMTGKLFEEELHLWNAELRRKNRKILLLLDNCAAHPKLEFSNIMLTFLPPNCTASLQPMDQGIIRCLKSHYRRRLMVKLLEASDRGEKFQLSLLDAIHMIAQSWDMVSSDTIRNCFKHSGIASRSYDFDEEDELPLAEWLRVNKEVDVDEMDLPLSDWLKKYVSENATDNFPHLDNFVDVDDDLVTSETPSDLEIVSEVMHQNQDEQNSGSGSDSEPENSIPDHSEVSRAMKLTLRYLESLENVDNNVYNAGLQVFNFLERQKPVAKRQTTITDYFV